MEAAYTAAAWCAPMAEHTCLECGARLSSDEIALHLKLIGRNQTAYRCLDSQARFCNTTRSQLEALIEKYHRLGTCTLFAKY